MYAHRLVYGEDERSWQITALELYLCTGASSDVWRDPYTHTNPVQLEYGKWYVHDDGGRAPHYSGIDIACGSREHGIYAGMLIRELDHEQRWVFQRIVRGADIIKCRQGNRWRDHENTIIQNFHAKRLDESPLRLVEIEENDGLLYLGPRIGLKKERDAQNLEQISYRDAPLRIAAWQTAHLKTKMNLYTKGSVRDAS
jgi:hypothetical protein